MTSDVSRRGSTRRSMTPSGPLHPHRSRAFAGGHRLEQLVAGEQQPDAVVRRVAGRHSAGDRLAVGGAPGGVGGVVHGQAARQEAEAGCGPGRSVRAGDAGSNQHIAPARRPHDRRRPRCHASCSRTSSAVHPPDRQQVLHAAAADVDQVGVRRCVRRSTDRCPRAGTARRASGSQRGGRRRRRSARSGPRRRRPR